MQVHMHHSCNSRNLGKDLVTIRLGNHDKGMVNEPIQLSVEEIICHS